MYKNLNIICRKRGFHLSNCRGVCKGIGGKVVNFATPREICSNAIEVIQGHPQPLQGATFTILPNKISHWCEANQYVK